MRAVFHDRYGALDGLAVRDIPVPVARGQEVRVRVHAAAVHIGDCFCVRGAPLMVRLMTGLLRPGYGVPGFDLAGTVEAVGEDVKALKAGDEVFGEGKGTCAEYARAREDRLALKPAGLSFQQAAALPTSGLAALHGLRDAGALQAGHKVLINGASGGVGTFAVQIARALGAEVTAVCSSANVELVRSLGANHVVDYTREDFTRGSRRYDLIFDNVENRTLSECRRVLTPTGTLILNSGTGAQGLAMLRRLVAPLLLSPFLRQNLRRFLSEPNDRDLRVLARLVDAGDLVPVIDRICPLQDTAAALGYIENGHARGKVVITP